MAFPIAEAVAGAVGGLGNIGLGVYNAVKQNEINQQNYQLQKQAYEYNKYVTENQHQIAARDLEKAGLSKTLAAGSANTAQNISGIPQMQATDWSQINPLNAISQMANLASTVSGARLASEQAKTQQMQQAYIKQQTDNSALDGVLKAFNNAHLEGRYNMEVGRYGMDQGKYKVGLGESLARTFNIYRRLEMDRLLNNAKINNLNQETANARLDNEISNWDFDFAKKHELPVKNRSIYGNIVNDMLGTLSFDDMRSAGKGFLDKVKTGFKNFFGSKGHYR